MNAIVQGIFIGDEITFPDCPDCNQKLVHSSSSHTPGGIKHACGCMKCKALYEVGEDANIERKITA